MICIVPVHSAVPRIETFAADLLKKGKQDNHILHLVTRKCDEELCQSIGDQLSENFRKVTYTVLPEKARTAVGLGNDMFKAAFEYRWRYVSSPDEIHDHPVIFMSPDYRPSNHDWLNDLQAEFFLKQAVTMGRTLPGKAPKSRVYEGPVLFGSEFIKNAEPLEFLNDADIWRVRLCWHLAKGSVETKLIGQGNKSVVRKIADPK
jgi:hypothetical protein